MRGGEWEPGENSEQRSRDGGVSGRTFPATHHRTETVGRPKPRVGGGPCWSEKLRRFEGLLEERDDLSTHLFDCPSVYGCQSRIVVFHPVGQSVGLFSEDIDLSRHDCEIHRVVPKSSGCSEGGVAETSQGFERLYVMGSADRSPNDISIKRVIEHRPDNRDNSPRDQVGNHASPKATETENLRNGIDPVGDGRKCRTLRGNRRPQKRSAAFESRFCSSWAADRSIPEL